MGEYKIEKENAQIEMWEKLCKIYLLSFCDC